MFIFVTFFSFLCGYVQLFCWVHDLKERLLKVFESVWTLSGPGSAALHWEKAPEHPIGKSVRTMCIYICMQNPNKTQYETCSVLLIHWPAFKIAIFPILKQGSVMVFDTNYLKTITDNLGRTKSLTVSTKSPVKSLFWLSLPQGAVGFTDVQLMLMCLTIWFL